jgi:hypothetical protein
MDLKEPLFVLDTRCFILRHNETEVYAVCVSPSGIDFCSIRLTSAPISHNESTIPLPLQALRAAFCERGRSCNR